MDTDGAVHKMMEMNLPRQSKNMRSCIIRLQTLMKKQKLHAMRMNHSLPLTITARHMVIPYMPMLIPPVKWSGYDKGAHLYLPSYIMRIHGSKHQREALKRAPQQQLTPVFETLDTHGSIKWRVNKRVLSVVERIWSSGGRLADLVDRNDWVTQGALEVDIGANPSAEGGGEDEGVDDQVVKVVDIIDTFRL